MPLECVDIITEEGVGISVWAHALPADDEPSDGPMGKSWLDVVYPGPIPRVETAIAWAKKQVGDFLVKAAG